jgi:hypothetical protein
MEFNFYRTYYDIQKFFMKKEGLKNHLSPEEYYRELVCKSLVDNEASAAIQSISEITWLLSGRPYFKIYPDLIPVFSRCPLDIPASLIEFPYGLTAFAIYMPMRDENSLIIDDHHYVRSILVFRYRNVAEDVRNKLGLPVEMHDPDYDSLNNRLTFWVDVGETAQGIRLSLPVYTYKQLAWKGTETVDESLSALPNHPSFSMGLKIPLEVIDQCARLVLSVCFLAKSQDGLILPDVLSADRPELMRADEKRIQILVDRAKKKGKYGWVIGSNMMSRPSASSHHVSEHEREFSYAHIRLGHWHKVLYGPGKSMAKVIWYRPTVVRPDLPFKSS